MEIIFKPIAYVKNSRSKPVDDNWGQIISEIHLEKNIPAEAFNNISLFSHLEIIYFFHLLSKEEHVYSSHPRENIKFPSMGIFAQRKKDRPNKIGLCTVELIEHSGRILKVRHLDAIDGSPVIDIKPFYKEFLPTGETRQPAWVSEMMKDYW